jgi:hypothetical protein
MTEFADCPVDLRYLAENQPSLCIPRVFPNIKEDFIRSTFEKLGLGKIQRIDLISRRTEKGEMFNRAFIHFDNWFWNADAQEARKRLITGKDIKIVYDNPWFWKVSANKWSPRTSDHRGTQLPNVVRPTEPFITTNIAPTLNVGRTLFTPELPLGTPSRRERPHHNERRAHQHRHNKHERKEDKRLPEMHSPITPPPTHHRHAPRTPPEAPPRRQRPREEDVHREEVNTELDFNSFMEEPKNGDFNVTDVRDISYGDVSYPPPRKILKRPPKKLEIPSDPLYDDIETITKDIEVVVEIEEN